MRLWQFWVLMVGLSISSSLWADRVKVVLEFEPDLDNGKEIFEVCASCHLPEGWGHPDGTYPQLAGQHRNVLLKQLLDIRSGARENNVMYPFVQERTIGGYQSIADVVAYISTLPMSPEHGRGPWKPGSVEFDEGKVGYQQRCQVCHGATAEGSDENGFPKLQRQHYQYLLNQIRLIKQGYRRSEVMEPIISGVDDQSLEKILSYISYLDLESGTAVAIGDKP